MGIYGVVALCAAFLCLIATVRCDDPYGAFVFPSNGAFTKPVLSKLNVTFGSNMSVEYQYPKTATTLQLLQTCYSESDVIGTDKAASKRTYYRTDIYENTGKLLVNIGNVEGNTNQTGKNFCLFVLSNMTITSCAYGPFGLIEFRKTLSNATNPIYSAIFRVLSANDTKSTVVRGSEVSSTGEPVATARPTTLSCPPSGIPPSPIVTPIVQIEQFPKMAANLTFPLYTWSKPSTTSRISTSSRTSTSSGTLTSSKTSATSRPSTSTIQGGG